MKRTEMITKLLKLYHSFPEGASDYHIIDFLLRKAENLGMLPPSKKNIEIMSMEDGGMYIPLWGWEDEEE